MKLTKAQRHELYKRAIILLMDKVYDQASICYALEDEMKKMFPGWYIGIVMYSDFIQWFPEVMKRKPKVEAGIYWWHDKDYKIRVKVLRQCIRETAPKRKSKVKPI